LHQINVLALHRSILDILQAQLQAYTVLTNNTVLHGTKW
jgi:hypothetical protein